jgi:hypothetical protein
LIDALKGKKVTSALSIGHGAAEACLDILDKCQGNKFISMVSYPVPEPPPKHFVLLSTVIYYLSWIFILFHAYLLISLSRLINFPAQT